MSELCLGCMKEYDNGSVCPHCGFSNDSIQSLPFLPLGTVLRDRYIVGKLLKSNCQGTEYLCFDDELKSPCILREFLPEGICGRSKNSGVNVVVKPEYKELYTSTLKSFLSNFRTLARLRDLSTIASIYDIFTDNNTAYTVEDYVEVISYREFINRSGGMLEWNVVRPLFMPLISSLESINKNNIKHLGISPDNVYVTTDGKIMLKNFMIPEMRQASKSFRADLIDGCSAPEQYTENKQLSQKADIYGFSAVLFYSLTGALPEKYEKRRLDPKLLINTNVVKRLPPHVVSALANGLQIDEDKRISSFEEYKLLLTSAPTIKAMRDEINTEVQASKTINDDKKRKRGVPGFVWGIGAFAVFAVLFFFVCNALFTQTFFDNVMSKGNSESDTELSSVVAVNADDISTDSSAVFTVPNLTKLSYEELLDKDAEHSEYNIVFADPCEYDDKVKQNYVIKQNPAPETEASVGSVIVVTLSKGTKTRTLPDINGNTLSYAAEVLASEGFVTYVERSYNDNVAEGCVIGYQNNYAGDKLEYGSSVTILVSRGSHTDSDSE